MASVIKSILIPDKIDLDYSGVSGRSGLAALNYVDPNNTDSSSYSASIGDIVERSSQGISESSDSLFTEHKTVFIQQSPTHEQYTSTRIIGSQEASLEAESYTYFGSVNSSSKVGESHNRQGLSADGERFSESLYSEIEKTLGEEQSGFDCSSLVIADDFPKLDSLMTRNETFIDLSKLELTEEKEILKQDAFQIDVSELVDSVERSTLEEMLSEALPQTLTDTIPKGVNESENLPESSMFHRPSETMSLGALESHENPLDL